MLYIVYYTRYMTKVNTSDIVTYCYNLIKKRLDTNCIFTVYYSIRKRRKYMDNKCDKCGKIPANVEYKGGKYCTWYCAKKG